MTSQRQPSRGTDQKQGLFGHDTGMVRVLTQCTTKPQNLPEHMLLPPGSLYLRHRGTLWSSLARGLILTSQVTLETIKTPLLPLVHSL